MRALVPLATMACGLAALVAPLSAVAQAQKPAPVEDRSTGTASPLLLQQQRATVTYREVTQAAFESKRAEQDVLSTQDSYNAARERADALKIELDKAIAVRDVAKVKEAAARKRYDAVLNAETR